MKVRIDSKSHIPLITIGIVAYGAASYVMAERIVQCLHSFFGALAILCTHHSLMGYFWRMELIEFWFAGLIWIVLPVASCITLLKRTSLGRNFQRNTQHRSSTVVQSTTFKNIGGIVLAFFLLIALLAPIVAPLPSTAQGDLQSTRYLPPLSTGVVYHRSPSTRDLSIPLPHFAEQIYLTNENLLHPSLYFTRSVLAKIQPGSEDSTITTISSIVFIFGTDTVGRDIFSRIVYGTRYSLGIGVIVVVLSILLGSIIGIAAGYWGRILDTLLMRTVDLLLSVPALFLILAIMAMIGSSISAMIVILAATGWMSVARIIRGEVLHLRQQEFVIASKLLGTSSVKIMQLHIVPNVVPVIKNAAVLQLGNIILAEASLGFLGLGIQPPLPSWGNMIAESINHLDVAMWLGLFPGLALSILLIAVHLVGEST